MKEQLILILIGSAAGMLSGLAGVGGGIIIVPCLVFFLGFQQHMAQGTSLATMSLPVAWMAYETWRKTGNVDFGTAAWLAAGFAVGGFFAVRLVPMIDGATLSKGFGLLMVLVGLKMLFGK